jgi:hypothetical protein
VEHGGFCRWQDYLVAWKGVKLYIKAFKPTYATADFPEIVRDPLALGCGNRGPWFLGRY